jgi:hypothetical protein
MGINVTARSKAKLKRSLKGDITMLFYTATIIISFLIVVPIIILIHKLDSSINEANSIIEADSDFSFDKRLAVTASTSGQKCRVRPMNLDCTKFTIRLKHLIVRPIREEMPASNDKSIKIVAREVPKS